MPAGRITVDIDRLDALESRLRAIQHKLGVLAADFGLFDADIGAPQIKRKLSDVAGNWSNARQRVHDEIGHLADLARSASDAYRNVESTVSGAAKATLPGLPGAGGGGA